MKHKIRPLTAQERRYTYAQSQQVTMQSGCIGYLRGDMGTDGNEFYTTWNNQIKSLRGDTFGGEFNEIVNALRFDESYGGVLKDRVSLSSFCKSNPASLFENTFSREYGFRIDTQKYSYLMRLNPNKGEYNFYIYAYRRDLLDRHLHQALRGIRFITPRYEEKFRLADTDSIRIISSNNESRDHECRYIDDYHIEVGKNLYHICEFAERMEEAGNAVIPLRRSLPDKCYAVLPGDSKIIIIKKGESGYYKTDIDTKDKVESTTLADTYNEKLGVSKAQREAMVAGSMFGWHVPAADPSNYDGHGKLKVSANKDRENVR